MVYKVNRYLHIMQIDFELMRSIQNDNKDRIPKVLAIKYQAMQENPYRFFRATANQFFRAVPSALKSNQVPNAWICGDLHLENFGSYKGESRSPHFAPNDFDEASLAPCLLDPLRMMASIWVAGKTIGLSAGLTKEASDCFLSTYLLSLSQGYIRSIDRDSSSGLMQDFLNNLGKRKRKDFLDKRTKVKKGQRKFIIDESHTSPISEKEFIEVEKAIQFIGAQNQQTEFYQPLDIVFRIAGTSSLGLRRYLVLVAGKGGLNKNYLLDLKEVRPSCLSGQISTVQPIWANEADRIVEVQQRVLHDPPALLNAVQMDGRYFVVKEMQPTADRIDYTSFNRKAEKWKSLIQNMAQITAWGTLRSAGRQGSAKADDLIYFAQHANGEAKLCRKFAENYPKVLNEQYSQFVTFVNKLVENPEIQ